MDKQNSIEVLPKIGKTIAAKLRALNIKTVNDLIYYFPFRYDDYSESSLISGLVPGERANVVAVVEIINNKKSAHRRMNITEALLSDSSGLVKAVWFNQPFIATNLKPGDQVSLSGKISEDFSGPYFMSPTYEKLEVSGGLHTRGLIPNYHLTAGLTQKQLRFFIKEAMTMIDDLVDWQADFIIKELNLMPLAKALEQIHFPKDNLSLEQAKFRLSFDELFLLQLKAQLIKQGLATQKARQIEFKEEATRKFVSSLPFELTPAQKQTAWEIVKDIGEVKPMMRLVQGDVGSGKTVVAMIPMYNTALNFRQSVLMAPTEILAKQHYQTFVKFLEKTNLKIGLVVSSDKKLSNRPEAKRLAVNEITTEADIIIGTQALIQDKVKFRDLALVVIDEQHRFGVEQRAKLNQLVSEFVPHLLSMTATPIPRTLALTLYDELEFSVIKQMPKGRLPVKTKIYQEFERAKAYDLVTQEIKAGRQAFVVCPLIDPSDFFGAKSVKEEYERLKTEVFGKFRLGLLHGKMSNKEKEKIMADFSRGELDILVSTAVVEVGVDIPNATIMMIESADRFGLAQLHQYRGRVGRGEDQAYCLLMVEDASKKSLERLECLAKYTSGFDLAEADLQFRGPGEVFGVMQKGFPELKLASLFDYDLMNTAKILAKELIKRDVNNDKYQQIKVLAEEVANTHLE